MEDQTFTVGTEVPLVLPESVGGTVPLTYAVSPALPDGLEFDAASRQITGIPTAQVEQSVYRYAVVDANAMSDSTTLVVTVAAAVVFLDAVGPWRFTPGHPIAPFSLPESAGGAPPLTYSLSPALPPALAFAR